MKLLSADSERQQSATLQDPATATDEAAARLRRARHMRVRYPRLERLCRPQSESFWVLGGRPGSFKTGLLWNLALNAAENGLRVMFATLEMTPGEMGLLALAKFSGIDRRRIEAALAADTDAPFTDEERRRWDFAVLHFGNLAHALRLHGAEAQGRDVDDVLRSACRARFDAVFVDHLGMIGRGAGRELDVLSHAIDRLRGLSRGEVTSGYRPWVVATSQLNREIDKGDEDRIPRLSDFRGSARIEHDADVAIGLQKRRQAGDEGATSMLDGFVLKNRHGPAPEILLFEANGAIGLITERHKGEQPPRPWQDGSDE